MNGTDYNTVLRNSAATGQTWTGGDFAYSGTITGADYNAVLNNFDNTLANVLPGGSSPAVATTTHTTVAKTPPAALLNKKPSISVTRTDTITSH